MGRNKICAQFHKAAREIKDFYCQKFDYVTSYNRTHATQHNSYRWTSTV